MKYICIVCKRKIYFGNLFVFKGEWVRTCGDDCKRIYISENVENIIQKLNVILLSIDFTKYLNMDKQYKGEI